MFKWINSLFAKKYKKEAKPRTHKELTQEAYERFHPKGDGIYICNFKGVSNSFVAKVIQYFSGELTHSFIVVYSTDLRSWFTDEQWLKLSAKWNYYYGVTTGIPVTTKALVIGSMDSDGMNVFDYANYQHRIQSIRKVPINSVAIKAVIAWLCQDKVLNSNYDYTGLVFFLFKKIMPYTDVKEDFFCSEIVFDAFYQSIGLRVAKKHDPSPKQIEDVNKNWVIFSNL